MTEVVKPVINIIDDEIISKNVDDTSSLYSIETGTEESPSNSDDETISTYNEGNIPLSIADKEQNDIVTEQEEIRDESDEDQSVIVTGDLENYPRIHEELEEEVFKKVLDEDQLIITSYHENETKDQQNPESVNIKKTVYDNVADDFNTHNVTEEYISSGNINEELSKINTTTEYFHSLSDYEDQSFIFTKNNQEHENYDNQPDNLNTTKENEDLIILENTNEEIGEINTTSEYLKSVTDPSESSYENEQSNAGIVKDGGEYTNDTEIDEELEDEESEKVLDKTGESEIIYSESFNDLNIRKDTDHSTEEMSEINANTENEDQFENIYDLNNSLEITEEEAISDGKMVLIEENATDKEQEIESFKSMDISEYENINKELLNEEENDLSSTNTQNEEKLNSNAKEYTSEGDNIDSNEIRDMNESKRYNDEEEVTQLKQNPETNDNDLVRTTITSIEVSTSDLISHLNNDLLNNSLEAQLTSSVDFEAKGNKIENNDQESNQLVTVEESENILNSSDSKTNDYTNNLQITEATLLIPDDKLNNTEENNQNSFEYVTSEASENTSNWITDINLHSETTEKTEQNIIRFENEEMPKFLDILKDIQMPNKQVTPLPIDDKAATSFESYQPPDVGRTFNDNLADESAGIGKALPVFVTDISRRSTIIIIFSCVTAFLFIVISLIIFLISFQRQHGTLDIEKQERNCGKDDLDEEDAQTFTKLLEVELPLSVVLALDESEECL